MRHPDTWVVAAGSASLKQGAVRLARHPGLSKQAGVRAFFGLGVGRALPVASARFGGVAGGICTRVAACVCVGPEDRLCTEASTIAGEARHANFIIPLGRPGAGLGCGAERGDALVRHASNGCAAAGEARCQFAVGIGEAINILDAIDLVHRNVDLADALAGAGGLSNLAEAAGRVGAACSKRANELPVVHLQQGRPGVRWVGQVASIVPGGGVARQ